MFCHISGCDMFPLYQTVHSVSIYFRLSKLQYGPVVMLSEGSILPSAVPHLTFVAWYTDTDKRNPRANQLTSTVLCLLKDTVVYASHLIGPCSTVLKYMCKSHTIQQCRVRNQRSSDHSRRSCRSTEFHQNRSALGTKCWLAVIPRDLDEFPDYLSLERNFRFLPM